MVSFSDLDDVIPNKNSMCWTTSWERIVRAAIKYQECYLLYIVYNTRLIGRDGNTNCTLLLLK